MVAPGVNERSGCFSDGRNVGRISSGIGLESVVKALIEEVVEEEMLLRPPGLGDVGRTIRWVNHFES